MVKNIGNLQIQDILNGETVNTIYNSSFRSDNCNFNPYGEDFLAPDFLQNLLIGINLGQPSPFPANLAVPLRTL